MPQPTPHRLIEPLMTLPEVAQALGVNERHVRRLVQERRIPFIKWGHLLRFDPDDVEAWILRHRVGTSDMASASRYA